MEGFAPYLSARHTRRYEDFRYFRISPEIFLDVVEGTFGGQKIISAPAGGGKSTVLFVAGPAARALMTGEIQVVLMKNTGDLASFESRGANAFFESQGIRYFRYVHGETEITPQEFVRQVEEARANGAPYRRWNHRGAPRVRQGSAG